MAGAGRGLLATENLTTTSTWVGIVSTILGALPQDMVSDWLTGNSGKVLLFVGMAVTVARSIDFPTLFYKLGIIKTFGKEI